MAYDKWRQKMFVKVAALTSPRQVEAYRLRFEEDMTYTEIANQLGYATPAGSLKAVRSVDKHIRQLSNATIEQATNAALTRAYAKLEDLCGLLEEQNNPLIICQIHDRILKWEQHISKLEKTTQDINFNSTTVTIGADDILAALNAPVIDAQAVLVEVENPTVQNIAQNT